MPTTTEVITLRVLILWKLPDTFQLFFFPPLKKDKSIPMKEKTRKRDISFFGRIS